MRVQILNVGGTIFNFWGYEKLPPNYFWGYFWNYLGVKKVVFLGVINELFGWDSSSSQNLKNTKAHTDSSGGSTPSPKANTDPPRGIY